MCMLQQCELDEDMQVVTDPAQATYDKLIGHCEQEHDATPRCSRLNDTCQHYGGASAYVGIIVATPMKSP
ncbi:hypothetical protein BC827DRAFT_1250241 [Russula dissimulans]|nr:hypothetical protein BC827DRAFT_1250241 [Russula dissimulans]